MSKNWHLHHGDCIPHMAEEMEPKSIDFAVFSPPFPAIFSYTSDPADMGNTDTMGAEATVHFKFFYRALARVMKPGRVVVVHVNQIPRMKKTGEVGLCDFRGINIRVAERAGLIYEYDWCVRRNPQSQALRTRSRELQFAGLESDRAKSRGALCDWLIKFRAPGENAVPVNSPNQVSRNQWIDWAEGAWFDIRETDTLNTKEAKGEEDTRHICVSSGSLVLTRRGHVPIEDVAIGDMVLTHKGRWKKVTGKRCNGIRPVVHLKAQGVPFLKVTADHRIWTRVAVGPRGGKDTPRKFAKQATPEWVEAKDTLASYVNQKLPPIEPSEYSIHEWWTVGRWLGDGYEHRRKDRGTTSLYVSCSYGECESLVKSLGKYAGSVGNTGTANFIRLNDPNHKLRDIVAKCGRKAHGKRLPVEALSLEPVKASSLLSGYLSADGHWNETHSRWMASSVSRALILGMSMIAQRVYGVCSAVYAGRKGGVSQIQGRLVNTKDDWIFSIPPRNLSGFVADDGAWKKVRSVDPCGEEHVWDLRVEDDESFTVEGCIVHNCPLQLGTIERLIKLYTNPGELVFTPFCGIGSEVYTALKLGRRGYGCEIKDEYVKASKQNFKRIEEQLLADKMCSLFPEEMAWVPE